MFRKLFNVTLILVMLLGGVAVSPAWSSPDVGDEDGAANLSTPDIERRSTPVRHPKNTDYPNPIDYQRLELRQRLLEAGQTAEAAALAQSGEDRVLVLLVEFTGTDVFTWTQGTSTWDPLGIVDANEWAGTAGNCSKIITATQTFTYTGPLHNEIPRPVADGRSIWTEDFNTEWFEDFMFGNGVVISYTTQNGTPIQENFVGKSVRDYYSDFSSGTYTITGDVVGWLPIDHSTWYYGADTCPGAISHYGDGVSNNGAIPGAGNNRQLVKDALDAVNAKVSNGDLPGFSWKDYDQNGDGVIDRLWIVHAGYGEEEGSSLNLVNYGESSLWSHSSAITPNYDVGEGIKVGPYIMMPENGGIGVFAHEYSHNLGADDLYAYGYGETSAGFWTIMADDWVGYPLGYQPPSPDPWHLDRWGWLDPMVITDTSKEYEFYLGQPSEFPGGEDTFRGAKIELAEGEVPLPVSVWDGEHYWFSGKQDLANGMMTTQQAIQVPAGVVSPTLSFDLVYDIEDNWDFLWVQKSTDNGVTWTTLTNANTICDHDSGWIGGMYGFPDDLCAAGIGGFTTYNANWPDPEAQTFDLGDVAGKSVLLRFWYMTDWGTTYTGAFIDNVTVKAGEDVYFSDDGESGPDKWVYEEPFQYSNGLQPFTHNFYLQWRNVNQNGGYDSGLGDARFRYGPTNTGLLVWYNNNYYTDNEVFSYLTDYPGFGPKGRMLVVDSHPDPYLDPYDVAAGYNNEGGNVTHRSLMRDAPFTITDTVDFSISPPAVYTDTMFEGRSGVSEFHDSLGYYPGAEYKVRGPGYPQDQFKWLTKQWDASVVIPSTEFYGIKAPGYTASEQFRYDCSQYPGGLLGCYYFPSGLGYDGGSGNPGDVSGQYGWHVQLVEEATDHTWAKVRVWNSMREFYDRFAADTASAMMDEELTFTYHLDENIGSRVDAFVAIPLDTSKATYVPGSAFGGLVPMPAGTTPTQLAAAYARGGRAALEQMAASQAGEVGTLVWTGNIGTGAKDVSFGFKARVKAVVGEIEMAAKIYDQGELFKTLAADPVTITAAHSTYMPLLTK